MFTFKIATKVKRFAKYRQVKKSNSELHVNALINAFNIKESNNTPEIYQICQIFDESCHGLYHIC